MSDESRSRRIRLKPADPFDLIRLLARSQNDPRKAVAELVQNSLDAGATEVALVRFRKSGAVCLSIRDNGAGVLPDRVRPDALHHLATHIGHSYKRQLTPEERYRLLQQGRYGIGLLGFWSVGKQMAIRSRVNGSEVFVLDLVEDDPDATVHPDRAQKVLDPTWTEVVIRHVHPAAQRLLTGRKLADYLAFELRGQLLERDARVRVVDRLARGRAMQDFPVRPPRFQGVPLREIHEWPVPDLAGARLRVDLYFLPEEHGVGRVTLASAGTVVADDLAALEAVDLRADPWNSGRLTGLVDAPFLDVAPGTRRGLVPNEKADAFGRAMETLAVRVREWLAARPLQKPLRRVSRDIQKRLPHYDLFQVKDGGARGAGDALQGEPTANEEDGGAPAEAPAAGEAATAGADALPPEFEEHPLLFPPGPLAALRLVPATCRLPVGAEKTLSARASDADGRVVHEGISFAWSIAEAPGELASAAGERAVYRATAVGAALVRVEARQGATLLIADAAIDVLEEIEAPEREDMGIPDPVEVKDPTGSWRSRLREGRWEYNGSHPDYLNVARDEARRFRFLATLLAKELVLRQVAGGAVEDRLLESLVEVLVLLDERLARGGRLRERRTPGAAGRPADGEPAEDLRP